MQKVKDKVSDQLASDEGGEPDNGEAQADDGIPPSHGDADEIPSDLVTAHDGSGEDLG